MFLFYRHKEESPEAENYLTVFHDRISFFGSFKNFIFKFNPLLLTEAVKIRTYARILHPLDRSSVIRKTVIILGLSYLKGR